MGNPSFPLYVSQRRDKATYLSARYAPMTPRPPKPAASARSHCGAIACAIGSRR